MPSPFPGMDPYLESPFRWPDVHLGIISELRRVLNRSLPSGYVARADERLYVTQNQRNIYPDVAVLRERFPPLPERGAAQSITTLVESDPSWTIIAEPLEMHEAYIEIISLEENQRVVTVIEILSPANKEPNSTGQRKYRQKQRELLRSSINFVEIDLLHFGEHTVSVPYIQLVQKGTWDYLICLHRAGGGKKFEVWPITLRQQLPRIRIPLQPDLPEVILDLQAAFDESYDAGGYRNSIDYHSNPSVPLRPEDAVWLDNYLREQGLRD